MVIDLRKASFEQRNFTYEKNRHSLSHPAPRDLIPAKTANKTEQAENITMFWSSSEIHIMANRPDITADRYTDTKMESQKRRGTA